MGGKIVKCLHTCFAPMAYDRPPRCFNPGQPVRTLSPCQTPVNCSAVVGSSHRNHGLGRLTLFLCTVHFPSPTRLVSSASTEKSSPRVCLNPTTRTMHHQGKERRPRTPLLNCALMTQRLIYCFQNFIHASLLL